MQLPFAFAQEYQVLLVQQDAQRHLFYTAHTPHIALLETQRLLYPQPYVLMQLAPETFDAHLTRHYAEHTTEALDDSEAWVELENEDLDAAIAQVGETLDLLSSEHDAPVIKLLNAILADAIRKQASDVHIEPFEDQLRVRFRMDGRLQTVLTLRAQLAPMLVSRVKVLAQLDISEKRLPQDGRIALKLGGRAVDLRVSTLPSTFGERAVLRLLDKRPELLDLKQPGMPADMLEQFRQLLSSPHGVILVTGPTGSGKTTTLYAALSHLNDAQRNIMTIEDPVEYNLPGINQTQVNTKAGMTFAKGLRAILRQDPDVVMIGEIRDRETADIAMQASLTGHLVLSTLHTNTAIGAVTRLRDMGVESFLLSAGLIGVMAQRLVRRLCDQCKSAYVIDEPQAQRLEIPPGTTLYRAQGCEACHYTGYRGRIALYELITIDEQMKQMIHDEVPEQKLITHVRQKACSLAAHARLRCIKGETSVEEVLLISETFMNN